MHNSSIDSSKRSADLASKRANHADKQAYVTCSADAAPQLSRLVRAPAVPQAHNCFDARFDGAYVDCGLGQAPTTGLLQRRTLNYATKHRQE
eukprot:309410-Chlamydomonas_euryale.AAC.3